MQAAIAACHAIAPRSEDTDWGAIVSWYDVLLTVSDNPVVRLNRAAALPGPCRRRLFFACRRPPTGKGG